MPRLFAALELPLAVRTRLSLLRGELATARWVPAENMHLTLRFFGDVTPAVGLEIADALDEVGGDAFAIGIRGGGAFGGARPTAVYAAVEPSAALEALQRAIERTARTLGLPPEPRPFVPHITLARLASGRPSQVATFLQDAGQMRIDGVQIDSFALMSSKPGSGGGPYGIEAQYPLDE